MPWREARVRLAGVSSTSHLMTRRRGEYSVARSDSLGASILHGPHQDAAKSRRTSWPDCCDWVRRESSSAWPLVRVWTLLFMLDAIVVDRVQLIEVYSS